MTQDVNQYFVKTLLPRLRKIARSHYRKRPDREDKIADFVAEGWQVYCEMSKNLSQPSAKRLLGAIRKRLGRNLEIRIPTVSLTDTDIRLEAEAIPV